MRVSLRPTALALGICLVTIVALSAAFVWWRIDASRLNVILITLDTTRADRVSCYGYKLAQTPALDHLATTGTLFEFARTTYPLTLPAHASIFTGINPPEHGLRSNGRGRLSQQIPVMAEILQNANYDTGAFIAAYVLNSKFGLNRGFAIYDDDLDAAAPNHQTSERRRDGSVVVDLALEWLEEHTSRHFFCWVHLYDPHSPYAPHQELFGDSFVRQPYDAGIAYADLQVARIKDFLAKQKLTDRTLVVIVGDHGEGLMQHCEPDHGYELYDDTLRVPLIFAGPNFIKQQNRVATPVSLIDVMPTILDCLKISCPKPVSGRSLKAALEGAPIPVLPTYAESELAFLESRCAPLMSVTTERWKFIESPIRELYDLSADPRERTSLADTLPDQVREMSNLLEELRARMRPMNAESTNLTFGEKEILASLGYVGSKPATAQPSPGEVLPDVKQMLPHYLRLSDARQRASSKDVKGAIEAIQEILDDVPTYSTARLLLGDLLVRQKEFAAAARQYSIVAEDQPDNAEARANWANALAAQNLFDQAIEHYQKAVEIDPTAAPYHYYFSFTLLRQGNTRRAITELEQAVKWNPAFVEAHLQLGKLLAQLGQKAQSLSHYQAALKYRPGIPAPAWAK